MTDRLKLEPGWLDKAMADARSYVRIREAASDLYSALERAERKLQAYVGVCKGDKELTETILPMARAALKKARGE